MQNYIWFIFINLAHLCLKCKSEIYHLLTLCSP